MSNISWNELEVASKTVVMNAAHGFVETLTETTQYREFEDSYQAFQQDSEAQKAYQTLREKQESLKAMMMLNALEEGDRQELKNLEDRFLGQASVKSYIEAQNSLISLCQEIGDILTDAVGLNFGLACRVGGCCG